MPKVDNYEDVLDTLEKVIETIENDDSDETVKSADFLEDVQAGAMRMKEWITNNKVATEKQANAANNWLAAVEKCLRDF